MSKDFAPWGLEIEQLIAYNESEWTWSSFAQQRAFNIQKEQEAVRQREEESKQVAATTVDDGEFDKSTNDMQRLIAGLEDDFLRITHDNVRYLMVQFYKHPVQRD